MPTRGENLIPPFTSGAWSAWHADVGKQPVFGKCEEEGPATLKITGKPQEKSIGKWVCQVYGLKGGATYSFSVDYTAINVSCEHVSISAILTWMNAEGMILARDYADGISKAGGLWMRQSRTLEIHPDAYSVSVELMAKWIPGGTVEWKDPFLAEIAPIPHRVVNVATAYFNSRGSKDENLALMLKAMDEAAQKKTDIICFTEYFYTRDVHVSPEEIYETIPGRLVIAISEKAKQYGMYAIVDMGEKENGDYYNTAVLIGRNGEVVGKYRKTHLPLCECERGVQGADDYPVFDTDFGKIGIMICWDQWFPEVSRILKLKGAEIIFVPTAGYAPELSQARAVENGLYLVISGGTNGEIRSRIINPLGEVTGGINESDEGVYIEGIDLDKKYYSYWMSVGPCFGDGPSIYMKERRPDTYETIVLDTKPRKDH